MIRINYTRYNGYSKLEIDGHAPENICTAVSWAVLGLGRQLEAMAMSHPDNLVFEFNNFDERSCNIFIPEKRKLQKKTPRKRHARDKAPTATKRSRRAR